MVLRIAFDKMFSRLPGGLEHLADGNSTPWSQPTIRYPDRTAESTADVPSFVLRTALSAIPFVSDR